jgi:hypothetical protein
MTLATATNVLDPVPKSGGTSTMVKTTVALVAIAIVL